MSTLSVVMLARDRIELTKQSLVSMLAGLKGDAGQLSLVIVDDASKVPVDEWLGKEKDGLLGLVNSFAYVIRNAISLGTGAARNQGVMIARERFERFGLENSLLYLSDNDVYFQPGWDKVLLAAHEQFKGFKIIGGGCHPFMQPHDLPYLGITGTEHRMTSRDAVSGYSWLLDWEMWDEFGPLDQNGLGVRQSEDWAMCQRIRKAGFYVGSVTPEVVLHTGVTDTFGERPPGWELLEAAKVEGVLYE